MRLSKSFIAPSFNTNREAVYPLLVLSAYLGEGETSKLYKKLVLEEKNALGVSVAYDFASRSYGGFSISAMPKEDVDAKAFETALDKALTLLEKNMPGATVTGLEAREWADAVARNREPLYPPVVGYAEIARMTGVTRQRAYAFPRIESFPKPVIETSQGPLYSEDAVRAWAQTRELRPGRPKAME